MDNDIPLNDAWRLINKIDWTKGGFSIEKAYVSALFAKLAYMHLPQYELEDKERIKVIPCSAYQEIAKGGFKFDLHEVLRKADFAKYFVIERRYAVMVGVITPMVIFVAIRGTKYLYDWPINLDSRRFEIASGILLHRGFFRAMAACFESLSEKLWDFGASNIPIYTTGHSLGGAMAAIMHALWDMLVFIPPGEHRRISTHSCYTFGMPRYGNFDAVVRLRKPYHIYNDKDIVPSVPPEWMGYASCFNEYMVNGIGIEKLHTRENIKFGSWILSLITGTAIANHKIELYLERIRRHAPMD